MEQTTLGTSRHKSPSLRASHRSRIAAVVCQLRAGGVKFTPTQDYRSAKTFAGVEHTCDVYLDRLEAWAARIIEDIAL